MHFTILYHPKLMVRKNIFDYMIEINLVIRELFIFTRTEYTDRLEKYLCMVVSLYGCISLCCISLWLYLSMVTRTEYTDSLEKYLSMVLLQFKWFAFSSFTTK